MTLEDLKLWINVSIKVLNKEIESLYLEWDNIPNGDKTMEGFEQLQRNLLPLKVERHTLFEIRDKVNEIEVAE